MITSNKFSEGEPGYNLYIFDLCHHQDYSSAQPIKLIFDIGLAVPAATILFGYALLLTEELVWVSGDGQRQFDLV